MKFCAREFATFVCIAPLVLLAGCSGSFSPGPETPVPTPLGSFSGTVHGGQQPIVGAAVTAFGTSTAAYGGASTVLATATTDSNGFFTFPTAATCTSGTVVYLYSEGGQPVTSQPANSAAGLMAVVGTCPAGGTLVGAAGAGASAQIYMNEVSTVAAAYALAGFAINSSNVSTDATHIGAATTVGGVVTDPLAQTGIQNAGANASQMYTALATGDGGGSNPGVSRAALATTPGGNGVVPQALLDTIANILAACINSSGSSSSACTTLFNDARSGGGQSGTQPTDTATAAIYMAQHPYSPYVSTLYNIVGSTANPFTPALGSAPTSFIVELIFSGGGLESSTQSSVSYPQTIAVDGSGNVWVANDLGNNVSEFSPLGVALSGSGGYTDSTCGMTGSTTNSSIPSTIAIATNGDAWVGINSANKVCVLSSTGGHLASVTVGSVDAGSGFDYEDGPYGIALDASGNAWVTDDTGDDQGEGGGTSTTNGQLLKINGSTYAVSTTATNSNGMNGPAGIAIQSSAHNGDIWVANFAANLNTSAAPDSVFTSGGTTAESFSPVTAGSITYGLAIAIDSNGYVWTIDVPAYNNGVSKTKYDGSAGNYYSFSGTNPAVGLSIDGAGNVWLTSQSNVSPETYDVVEVNNSGALLSPAAGYVPATDTNGKFGPGDPAVDLSGNVWYPTLGGFTLRELIGASIPVATPIAYGVANSKLGARP